jgi:trk system potassium uptake protein TrkA
VYIIVIGAGRIGYYLTKELLNEGHEVLVIEKNAGVCQTINEEMGNVCFSGDGCETTTLQEVGTGRADMLVAVTGDDEDNLVACQVAKHKHNVPRTIARIRNPRNAALFKKLGVDVTVNSTDLIIEAIEHEVPTHPVTQLLTLDEQGQIIVDVRIPEDSSVVGKTVKDLNLPPDSALALIIPSEGSAHVPLAHTVIQAGDQIIAITPAANKDALKAALSSK